MMTHITPDPLQTLDNTLDTNTNIPLSKDVIPQEVTRTVSGESLLQAFGCAVGCFVFIGLSFALTVLGQDAAPPAASDSIGQLGQSLMQTMGPVVSGGLFLSGLTLGILGAFKFKVYSGTDGTGYRLNPLYFQALYEKLKSYDTSLLILMSNAPSYDETLKKDIKDYLLNRLPQTEHNCVFVTEDKRLFDRLGGTESPSHKIAGVQDTDF